MLKCLSIILVALVLFRSEMASAVQRDSVLLRANDLYEKAAYDDAIKLVESTLNRNTQTDKTVISQYYRILGNCYSIIGKTEAAMQNYMSSVKISEQTGDKLSKAKTLANIGAMYSEIKDFNKALFHFSEAESIAFEIGDSSTIADCANNKGIIFEQQKKYSQALLAYTVALKLYQSLNQQDRIAISYNNLGIVYKFLEKFDSSISCYKQSLTISQKIGSPYLEAANQINLGNVYEKMGNYAKAIQLNKAGLATGKKLGSQEIKIEALANLANDYEKEGNYRLSNAMYREYVAAKDSFINIERSRQVGEIQARYETEKKENEILKLQKQKEIDKINLSKNEILLQKRNSQMIAIFVIVLLGSGVAFLFYNQQRLKQRQIREAAIAKAEQNERIRIARDVHDDLGSGLSKISLLSENIKHKVAGGDEIRLISQLSHELVDNMRDLIWVLNPENTTLDHLISRLREYCGDYGEGLDTDVEFRVNDSVPDIKINREAQRNIFLTVKEALNNAVKYSCSKEVLVDLQFKAGVMSISIKDNGKGFNIDHAKNGNGLRNMPQRIKAIGGDFSIASAKNEGTFIKISVPVHSLVAKNTTFV